MAYLWTRTAGKWMPSPLTAAAVLRGDGVVADADVGSRTPVAVPGGIRFRLLARSPDASPETWVLLAAASDLRLNGTPLPLGVAVLEDRDEIRRPGIDAWFCTQGLARVEPFPSSVAGGVCPRCKQAIEAGSSAVRCPGCRLWHHATDDLPCWSYAPTCATCAQATAVDAGFCWTPEDL